MAKFWNHLEHHPDTVVKRPITQDELRFLVDLQKEMNTQDHCGTVDPRYWVIADYKRVYGDSLNCPEGICIYETDGCGTIYEGEADASAILDALIEEYPDDFARSDLDQIDDYCLTESLEYFLEEKGYDGLHITQYDDVQVNKYFFLTEKAAADYLRRNDYHHDEKAHTYCMYSWRSPEEKTLWKILHEVDFSRYLQLEDDGK